jgi:hypothetical protein
MHVDSGQHIAHCSLLFASEAALMLVSGAAVLLFAETALVSVSEAALLFWLGQLWAPRLFFADRDKNRTERECASKGPQSVSDQSTSLQQIRQSPGMCFVGCTAVPSGSPLTFLLQAH